MISGNFDRETINTKLFDNPNGIFLRRAEQEFTDYFDTPVCIENVSELKDSETDLWIEIIIIALLSCCLTIITASFCNKYIQKKRKLSYTTYINNPLVIAIAIGKYDQNNENPEINGIVQNLVSIDNDIKNIVKIFGMKLNYEINPNYDINKPIKTRWTKNEIFELLKQQANYLNKSVKSNKYDSLIVIISSHGIKDHIITSDYGKINKDTIHRIFSVDYPSLRDIPAIFLYDCCDGENDMIRNHKRTNSEEQVLQRQITKGEYVKVDNHIVVGTYGTNKEVWYKGEANPDYKLVIINSSNPGFVSQMGAKSGSYMITKFTQKMHQNLARPRGRLFLYEIFHQIQTELHDEEGKQLIEAKYNNKLEYIKFKRNDAKYEEKGEELIELTEIDDTDSNESFEMKDNTKIPVILRKCAQCKDETNRDEGEIDENDGNWYCKDCWDCFYE